MTSQRNITIKDVAKRCDVSVSTVSRVLNGLDRVNSKTRTRVQKAIKDLNYVPNRFAISMVTKKTKILAVSVPNINNPFYSAVIQGVIDVAKEHGYHTCVTSTQDSEEEEAELFQGFLSRHVDGIVWIGTHTNPLFYESIALPVVLVDRYIDEANVDGVVIDNFKGAYEATRHILQNGHKKIAIINGLRDYCDGRERFWGFQQAIKDFGLEVNPAYCIHGDWTIDNGYNGTIKLLKSDDPPTAIFAANNMICTGMIRAISDLNLRIGEDVSIVGFDENELAENSKPQVTIVKRPTYEMGALATQMLMQRLDGNEFSNQQSPTKMVLSVELVIRGSVKSLAME